MLLIPPDFDSSLLSSAQELELGQAIESEISSRLAEKALDAPYNTDAGNCSSYFTNSGSN
jgi:hypothetical protein